MKLTQDEVNSVLGMSPPEKTVPVTKEAKALDQLGELDQRVRRHVEKNSKPGESYEASFTRQMGESPSLYSTYQGERDRIVKAHGIGREAEAQPLGTQRGW
jgi:hypothetical protein